MNNQWQKYVDAAKQQQPLLSQSDVQQLLLKPKAKVVVKKRWLNFKLLFTMSMLTTLFVGLMWLQQPTSKTVITQQTSTANTPKIIKVEKPSITSLEPTNIGARTPKTNYVFIRTTPNEQTPETENETGLSLDFNTPAFTPFQPTTTAFAEPERNYFNENGELVLTYDELEKLGILTNGKVLDYKIITDTPFAFINNGIRKMEYPIFTIHVDAGGQNSLNGMTDTLKEVYFKDFFAIVIEDTTYSSRNKNHGFLKTELSLSRGYDLDYFGELKPNLIPVEVTLTFKSKSKHLVFWFKNEPAFIHALPEGVTKILAQRYGLPKPSSYYQAIRTKYRLHAPTTKSLDSLTILNLQKKMICLNDEALKELNITSKNNKLKMVFWESRVKNKKTIVERSVYVNKKSYYSYNHGGWKSLNSQKGLQKVHNSPIAVTDYSMRNITFLRNLDDSIGPFMSNPSYSYFARIAPKLHPVMVDSNNVIWFPDTYKVNELIQVSNNQKAGLDLHKMNKLVLTPGVLTKLNITYQPDGIRVPSFDNGVQSIYNTYNNGGSTSQLNGFSFKLSDSSATKNFEIDTSNKQVNIKITDWTSIPVPALVTDLNGIGWHQSELETDKFFSKEDEEYMIKNKLSPLTYLPYINAVAKAKELLTKQLTTFIPIVLKHPSIKQTGVIAWYKPDSAFLNLLPLELSSAIKQELNAINTNNKGASCTYFEACKELGMNWEINAFPNPTERELNLTIENSIESKYRVEITDIDGKIIKDLSRDVKLPSGKHQLSFDIANLAKGMYLLQVINDKKEILVKRIVKL